MDCLQVKIPQYLRRPAIKLSLSHFVKSLILLVVCAVFAKAQTTNPANQT